MRNVSDEQHAREISKTMYRYDKTASHRSAVLDDVGKEQVQRYLEEGYLVIDRFLSDREIGAALNEISDIIHERLQGPKVQFIKPKHELKTPEERELAVRKVYDYIDYAPVLHEIAHHERLLQVIESLLGDKPMLVGNQGLLKPPYGGTEKPWHQDMAYGGLFFKKQILGVWIALDEAGLDNGCMHIIPRSHLGGGVPHYSIRDWQMCDSHVDVERDVAVPLKPGGALIFSGLLHHGTPANFSAQKRRALQLRYAPASSKLMKKEEFKLMFTNELTDAEC
ncbi:phytanoyl-CoA dioxygenase family protein [Paenibacillus solisilvae]|uniref:Phytanoyl-CoA dioxygenase family protein n=1 Tax=Paenibacillus solisilvae TaxID=2486751 RepID=A0ABW0W9Y6_9BACL